jgi:hypothetical protein
VAWRGWPTHVVLVSFFAVALYLAGLLGWLAYWERKTPMVKAKSYYLLVAWAFCSVILAVGSVVFCGLAGISTSAWQWVSKAIGVGIWVLYFVLAICQLCLRRKYRREAAAGDHQREETT